MKSRITVPGLFHELMKNFRFVQIIEIEFHDHICLSIKVRYILSEDDNG